MKHLPCSLLAIMLCLAGCNNRSIEKAFGQIDSLIESNNDSALSLLEDLRPHIERQSEDLRMHYLLLRIKARDKADSLPATPQQVAAMLSYFEHSNGHEMLLPQVYYYAGRSFAELKNMPSALKYFLKAEKCNQQENLLKAKTYSQIGYIYDMQDLRSIALEYYHKLLKNSLERNDTISRINAYLQIGFSHYYNKRYKDAIKQYNEALYLSRASRNTVLEDNIMSSLAGCYTEQGENIRAKNSLPPLCRIPTYYQSNVYSIASKVFINMEMYDSAHFYINKILETGTIYAKKTAHKRLANLYLAKDNLPLAKKEFALYDQLCDSIERITDAEATAKAHAAFNYQSVEEENVKLQTKNQLTKYSSIMLSLLQLLVAWWFLQIILRMKKELLQKEWTHKEMMERLKKSSEDTIARNQQKIEQLKSEIERLNSSNKLLKTELQLKINILENENAKIEIKKKENFDREELLKQKPGYKLVRAIINKPEKKIEMTKTRWERLEKDIEDVYPGFAEALRNACKLNTKALHVCLLMKMNVSTTDIASLLGISKSAVSEMKRRLYERTFKQKGSAKNWDTFILSL